jgi:NADH-quinone oxidoreductase subunit N
MFGLPSLSDLNIGATLPVTLLVFGACVLLVVDLFVPRDRKRVTALLTCAGIGLSLLLSLLSLGGVIELGNGDDAFTGMFRADALTEAINVATLMVALLGVLVAYDYLERTGMQRGEYYILLLFSAAGAMLMGAANNLVIVFIALELLSIPLYILSGFRRPEAASEESAMKYFLLGAFSSGFLIYGIALIYGATGTLDLQGVWDAARSIEADASTARFLGMIGAGLVLVGLGFKVAAVPFHMWTPDVYQGAPTPVVAYMSVAAKVGGFGALVRVFGMGLTGFIEGDVPAFWQDTVWIIAVLTMILGNVVAIVQGNLKRLLAYSTIAHAGYILIAVAAAASPGLADEATQSVVIYLLAYVFTNAGAFAVITAIERNDGSNTDMDALPGLAARHPWLAAAMTVFMLSLTGIPLTAGFIGKWYVFKVALQADLIAAAIVGVLTSAISAYYYLRVVWKMYFEEGHGEATVQPTLAWGIGAAAIGTLVLGVVPYILSAMARSITLAFGG